MERIGEEAGEWLERYVEAIFKRAGFVTERDRIFVRAVKHEVDVWAEAEFATVAVECKDWRYMAPALLKKELDAFIAKVKQVEASTGLFVVNVPDTGQLQRYREYMRSNGLSFWDKNDVEKWIDRFHRKDYQKQLCDALGIQIRPPTKTEKAFGFLKTLGKAAYKSGQVAMDIAKQITTDEEPRKRRRAKKGRRRR